MATIQEKLAALAEEYEENARSIRKTMALMNGHHKEKAVIALPAKVRKATRMLTRQKGLKGKNVNAPDIVRDILATHGPQSIDNILPLVSSAGVKRTRKQISVLLNNQAFAKRLRKTGAGKTAQYSLPN